MAQSRTCVMSPQVIESGAEDVDQDRQRERYSKDSERSIVEPKHGLSLPTQPLAGPAHPWRADDPRSEGESDNRSAESAYGEHTKYRAIPGTARGHNAGGRDRRFHSLCGRCPMLLLLIS